MAGHGPGSPGALLGSLSPHRMGRREEIAVAISFRASPAASSLTGAVPDARGGYDT
ncbi:hypothetical protein ACH4C2_04530 [Streptomyces sp. NPDC018057]|uniref:hypothetical protein n=1 Tax=unclassified Streptomyces TaxID=2593676 RepID=UPI0037920B10